MKTTTTILLAAALLAAPPAVADGPRLAEAGIPVDPDRHVSGSFAQPGTQNWRVYLQQGKYYALYGYSDAFGAVTVRAAGGRALARFAIWDDFDGVEHGGSFRAPYTGLYDVAVGDASACPPHGTPGDCNEFPTAYRLTAARDCPGDLSTSCTIAVGQTLDGLREDFYEDDDSYRVSLQAGVPYVVTVADPETGQSARIVIRDARGRVVAQNAYGVGTGQELPFVAPGSGTYYVEVSTGDDDSLGLFSLSLTVKH